MLRVLAAAIAAVAISTTITTSAESSATAPQYMREVVLPHYLKGPEWESARLIACTAMRCVAAVRDVDDPDLGAVTCLTVVRVYPAKNRWRELDATCIQEQQMPKTPAKPTRGLH